MTLQESIELKKRIKNILKEDFQNYFATNEKSNKGDYSDGSQGNKEDGVSDAVKQKIPGKRGHVITMLKNPGLDNAPFAYRLWPNKDKANARSQFYKCRDGEKNDNGDVYSFTDKEIVRLYSMLTDTNVLNIK